MASIAKRPDGRWRARYRDESRREHAKHFDRKIDAQRWLHEVTAAVVTGQYVDPGAGRMTVTAFYADWSQRQVWESTTVAAMNLAVRSTPFAERPLRDVRRSHLEQWVRQMVDYGLAPGTIRTRVNNVRAVLRAAVRDRRIASDPSDGLVLPRTRRTEAALVIPTAEQVGAILAAADDAYRPVFALAAFAGLRLGEVAGVQVGDVDSCAASCTCADRYSERRRGRSRSGCPSTAPSGPCSWPTASWTCSAATSPPTARART